MQLIRSVFEVRYEEVPSVFDYKSKILSKLSVQTQIDKSRITENVNIKAENDRAVISVEANRTLLIVEGRNAKKANEYILTVYKKINELLKKIKDN